MSKKYYVTRDGVQLELLHVEEGFTSDLLWAECMWTGVLEKEAILTSVTENEEVTTLGFLVDDVPYNCVMTQEVIDSLREDRILTQGKLIRPDRSNIRDILNYIVYVLDL